MRTAIQTDWATRSWQRRSRWRRSIVLLVLALFVSFSAALAEDTEHAGANTEEALEAHDEGTPNLLKPEPGLLIWTLITFLVLMVVLSRTAWKPLMAGLEARESGIRKTLSDAADKHREAGDVLARYQQMLDKAKTEAQEIIDEGKSDALKLQHSMRNDARREAEEFKERARREVELAADQAKKELWSESTKLSTLLAEKILQRQLNSEDHQRLVEQMLEEYRNQSTSGAN